MDKVSVILPTYNRSTFISQAIHSVLAQGDQLGELIIIDDGSTDDTTTLITKRFNRDDIVYRKTTNRGPASARNLGVEMARYPYLAFIDSDDRWQPGKITKQMLAMHENPRFDISHTDEIWYRLGQHLNKKSIHKPRHGYIFPHCLQLCAVGMSTVIMKKELFLQSGGFDESLPCCEDYDLWLRLSWQHDFLLVPQALTIKEGGRPDQLSWQYRVGMDKYRIQALENLIENYPLAELQLKQTIEELKRKCLIYGNGCIKHGKEEQGRQYLGKAARY